MHQGGRLPDHLLHPKVQHAAVATTLPAIGSLLPNGGWHRSSLGHDSLHSGPRLFGIKNELSSLVLMTCLGVGNNTPRVWPAWRKRQLKDTPSSSGVNTPRVIAALQPLLLFISHSCCLQQFLLLCSTHSLSISNAALQHSLSLFISHSCCSQHF